MEITKEEAILIYTALYEQVKAHNPSPAMVDLMNKVTDYLTKS